MDVKFLLNMFKYVEIIEICLIWCAHQFKIRFFNILQHILHVFQRADAFNVFNMLNTLKYIEKNQRT